MVTYAVKLCDRAYRSIAWGRKWIILPVQTIIIHVFFLTIWNLNNNGKERMGGGVSLIHFLPSTHAVIKTDQESQGLNTGHQKAQRNIQALTEDRRGPPQEREREIPPNPTKVISLDWIENMILVVGKLSFFPSTWCGLSSDGGSSETVDWQSTGCYKAEVVLKLFI